MKITRRQFVQVMAVAGASALLTACGGSSNSTAGSGAAAATGGSFNLKLGHNLFKTLFFSTKHMVFFNQNFTFGNNPRKSFL